jgi:hypothetical protein
MKPSIESYNSWYQDKFNIDLDSKPANLYEYVITKVHKDFENCSFWYNLKENLNNYNDEYYLKYGYSLLKIENLPIHTKSY